MWRHRATCSHCGQQSRWNRDREVSEGEILTHLKGCHQCDGARLLADYGIERQRQCDFCLEPYIDDCTKCGQDFCTLHAGDIDGLCGGCI
jgi:hypothetical protein